MREIIQRGSLFAEAISSQNKIAAACLARGGE
jgi:hypothetical protein